MRFMIEFRYSAENRDKVLRGLLEHGVSPESALKVQGAWVAIETGLGYALVDSKDATALYRACSVWSDHGQVKVIPVVAVDQL